jgi:hypothetical protein
MTDRPPCGTCHGSKEEPCTQCQGRGSWYEPPTTATGTAQLVGCNYCLRSGRIPCRSCGGTGYQNY